MPQIIMKNSLRIYRRKTDIKITDIIQLLKTLDSSNLSKCERGSRKPTHEMLFVYHLIFDVSIEFFFEEEIQLVLKEIKRNIEPLIGVLKKQTQTKRITSRISSLHSLKDSLNKRV
jgi:transcriptional regulator with XRE-family HTH domain